MRHRYAAASALAVLLIGAACCGSLAQGANPPAPTPERKGPQPSSPAVPAAPPPYLHLETQGISRDEAQRISEETRAAVQKARRGALITGQAIPSTMATLQGMPPLESLFAGRDMRLEADFDNIPLREALARLFGAAKTEYLIDRDVDASQKVLLKAKNVRLISALQALTDQAGVVWTTEIVHRNGDKQFRPRYHISTSNPRPFVAVTGSTSVFSPRVATAMADLPMQTMRGNTWTFNVAELRQTFQCPHCKSEITMVRPKGPRTSKTSWHYCPICGKQVDMEDESGDERSEVVRLEPGSRLKIDVVSGPDDKEYNGTYLIDPSGQLRLKLYPVSLYVAGFTTARLEKELETRLRTWLKDPRVNATIVTKK